MSVNAREGTTPPEKRRTAVMAIAAAEVPHMTKQGHPGHVFAHSRPYNFGFASFASWPPGYTPEMLHL